jgi:hypothetical protein
VGLQPVSVGGECRTVWNHETPEEAYEALCVECLDPSWASGSEDDSRGRLFIHRILPAESTKLKSTWSLTQPQHPHFEDRPYPQKRTEALAWAFLGKSRIEEVEALAREIFPKDSSDITVVWGFPGVTHLGRWKKHTLALARFDKRDRAERLIELGHTMPALSFQPDKIYLTCPVVSCPEAPPAE